jgi:hypothetical protein
MTARRSSLRIAPFTGLARRSRVFRPAVLRPNSPPPVRGAVAAVRRGGVLRPKQQSTTLPPPNRQRGSVPFASRCEFAAWSDVGRNTLRPYARKVAALSCWRGSLRHTPLPTSRAAPRRAANGIHQLLSHAASVNNCHFVRVYAMRKPCRSAFRCEALPGAAHIMAMSHPTPTA